MSVDEEIHGAPDLYREHILDHYKSPRNQGKLEGAEIRHDGDNPVCGDMIEVWARVSPDRKITDIRFQGRGCAISQASASILYEDVKGKTLDEVKTMDRDAIFELLGMELTTARVKCGVLGLHVLKHGIDEFEKKGSGGAPAKPGGLKLRKLK